MKGALANKGPVDWPAMYPRLFELHGVPISLSQALAAAPEPVRELAAIVDAHPIELYRYEDVVAVRATDDAAASAHPDEVSRAMDLVDAYQDECKSWIWQMIR